MGDKNFVKKLKSGDKKAFEELFIEYKNMVYTIVDRMIYNKDKVEDITADIFLKIYKNIYQFDERSKLSTWMYRIAYNHCLDYISKLKKDPLASYKPLDNIGGRLPDVEQSTPEELVLKGEKEKALYAIVDSLPEKYRMVVNFYYFEGTSYKDISEIMGVPIGTVKTYLFRAKLWLKKKLEQMEIL